MCSLTIECVLFVDKGVIPRALHQVFDEIQQRNATQAKFSNVPSIMLLHSNCARALTCENNDEIQQRNATQANWSCEKCVLLL